MLKQTALHQLFHENFKLTKEGNSGVWYLAEFREVVLLTEGTLPQPRSVVADGLVVALSLRPPVSDTSDYTGDQLTWKKRRQRHQPHRPVVFEAAFLLSLRLLQPRLRLRADG